MADNNETVNDQRRIINLLEDSERGQIFQSKANSLVKDLYDTRAGIIKVYNRYFSQLLEAVISQDAFIARIVERAAFHQLHLKI